MKFVPMLEARTAVRSRVMTSSRKSAFTLLEILLVVLVVGITVAAFLPVALNTADQARTRSFLRQLISLNRYARSRALLDRSRMVVVYDPGEGWVRLMKAPTHHAALSDPALDAPAGTGGDVEGDTRLLMERSVPETLRIRSVEGAVEEEGRFLVLIDAEGVAASHGVEVVDPRGELRRIRFNGFTGEVDLGD